MGERPPEDHVELFFVGNATLIIRYGPLTLLTDPNFLHRGEYAYLGHGLLSRRRTEPALNAAALPSDLDGVILSHLHGDHFDRVARAELPRRPPVVTTPQAATKLGGWGFKTRPLATWATTELADGDERLRIVSVPAVHARGLMRSLLPPVMGSVLELYRDDEVVRRVYLSGDTVTGPHLDDIAAHFPSIDSAVVHLGGTRVLLHTVTMDAAQGVDFLRRVRPPRAVAVHHDDYGVFRSPVQRFVRGAAKFMPGVHVEVPERGATVPL